MTTSGCDGTIWDMKYGNMQIRHHHPVTGGQIVMKKNAQFLIVNQVMCRQDRRGNRET